MLNKVKKTNELGSIKNSIEIIKPKKKKVYNPLKAISLKKLVNEYNYKEPKWYVEPFLPEGLTVLAGKPKLGKSFFALSLGISIARGFKFMRHFNCEQSTVYYIPYEDSFARISRRIKVMLKGKFIPEKFIVAPDPHLFPKLTEGGLEMLKSIIINRPDVGVIIIDTFGRFVNKSRYGNLSFQEDYDLLSELQSLAIKKHVSILLIHHTTKAETNDVFDSMQGTMGIIASPDSLIVMKRKDGFTEMHIRGRDFEDKTYSIDFDSKKLKWQLKGDIRENGLSKQAVELLNIFKSNASKEFSLDQLKSAVNDVNPQNTNKKLKGLINKQLIEKTSRGCYKLNLNTFSELDELNCTS